MTHEEIEEAKLLAARILEILGGTGCARGNWNAPKAPAQPSDGKVTDAMVIEYNRLKKVQQNKGFKDGFVGHAFKKKFGMWPPDELTGRSKPAAAPEPQSGFGDEPPPFTDADVPF